VGEQRGKGWSSPGRAERGLVVVLLATFAAFAVLSMRVKNPTFDETAHLAAGVSYVQTGDFRLNPEHPVLPKLLAGVSARAAGAVVDTTGEAWRTGEQWDVGREVIYGPGVDWQRIVFAGRLPMVLLGLGLGALLWLWTRAMLGPAAAAIVLVLYAFSPSFLAHTRLVTTDVPLTLGVVGAAACLWRAWRTGSVGWTVAAAAFVAGTMVTKFSAFSYGPVWVLLAVLPSARRPWRAGLAHLGVFLLAAFVLTELAVSVCYGFAGDWTTIRALGMTGRGVTLESMTLLRRIPFEVMASIPWPSADFARGMKDIILFTEAGHPVYLLGRAADAGTWWSPLLTLGVKASLPFLLLALAGIGVALGRRAGRTRELLFVLAPPALVLATNVAANLGLGVRHLLPMFPFLMIAAARPFAGGGWPAGAGALLGVLALLFWHAVGTAAAFPHYISWFNEVARFTGGGARYLGDSNLDWGQDLSAAAAELRTRGVKHAVNCYFGTASPFVEGLDWQLLPPTQRPQDRDPWKAMDDQGEQWLLMSATNLQGIYYRAPGGGAPHPWLDGIEPRVSVGGGTILLYEISKEAEAQRGLARMYSRHGMREESEMALRRAFGQEKYDLDSRRRLAEIALARGDVREAETLMHMAPNPDVEMLLALASLRMNDGRTQEALTTYENSIMVFPTDPELKNAYAWQLQELGRDLDLALRLASDAVEWDPGDPYFRDTRGMVNLARGDVGDALADLDAALLLPGGDLPEIRWHRVEVLVQVGRAAEALAAAREIAARGDVADELRGEIEIWLLEVDLELDH